MLRKSSSNPCISRLTSTPSATPAVAEDIPDTGAVDSWERSAVEGTREMVLPMIVLHAPRNQIVPVVFRVPGRDIDVHMGELQVSGEAQVRLQPVVQWEPDRIVVHQGAVSGGRSVDVQQLEPRIIHMPPSASPPTMASPAAPTHVLE